MKRITTLLAVIFIFSVGSRSQTFDWAISSGGKGVDMGTSICVDVMGNSYITGSFMSSPLKLGSVSLNNSTTSNPGKTASGGNAIPLVQPGIRSAMDMFVAKVDPTGKVVWAIQSEGSGEELGVDISCDPTGHVVVVGTIAGKNVKFGDHEIINERANSTSIFLLKLNALGEINWVRNEATKGSKPIVNAVSSGPDGEFYITGTFTQRGVFSDNLIESKNGNNPSAFVARYHSNGVLDWLKQINGTAGGGQRSLQSGEAIFATNDSRFVYVAGWFRGNVTFGDGKTITSSNFRDPKFGGGQQDFFITKYGSDGVGVWTQTVSMSQVNFSPPASIEDIVVDHQGSAFLTGSFPGILTFGEQAIRTVPARNSQTYNFDIFVAKIDQTGKHLWQRTAGDSEGDWSNSIALTPSGIVITGNISGRVKFGDILLTSRGLTSFFTAAYDSNGKAVWASGTNGPNLAGTNRGTGIAANGKNTVVIGTFTGNQIGFPNVKLGETGTMNIFVAKMK